MKRRKTLEPGRFTVTGAPANVEVMTGLPRLQQQVDIHISMAEKLLNKNPLLTDADRHRVERHFRILKNIADGIMARKGEEWVPTLGEINAMFNAASTLGGFGWRFDSTKKAFQKLDDDIRMDAAG